LTTFSETPIRRSVRSPSRTAVALWLGQGGEWQRRGSATSGT